MADGFQVKSMNGRRKNKNNLVLQNTTPKATTPSSEDSQLPGSLGNKDKTVDTLEIGVEFQLDLRSEDLVVLRELGAGNGGTVSKVMHSATKVVMARKVPNPGFPSLGSS